MKTLKTILETKKKTFRWRRSNERFRIDDREFNKIIYIMSILILESHVAFGTDQRRSRHAQARVLRRISVRRTSSRSGLHPCTSRLNMSSVRLTPTVILCPFPVSSLRDIVLQILTFVQRSRICISTRIKKLQSSPMSTYAKTCRVKLFFLVIRVGTLPIHQGALLLDRHVDSSTQTIQHTDTQSSLSTSTRPSDHSSAALTRKSCLREHTALSRDHRLHMNEMWSALTDTLPDPSPMSTRTGTVLWRFLPDLFTSKNTR